MRMSSWTPDIVRFMEDAASVTDYFEILAQICTRGLPRESLMLDAGCGMGQLAIELAKHGHRVDAIDKSPQAIAYAQAKARETLTSGCVRVRQGDFRECGARARSTHGAPYDRIVFCLSARVEDAFATARENGTKSLVVINKMGGCVAASDDASNRLPRPAVCDVNRTLDALDECGIVCDAHEISLEFGQPFRTLDDAARYFSLFRTRSFPHGVTKRELMATLEPFDERGFAYYLPVERHLVMFAVDMEASLRASLTAVA